MVDTVRPGFDNCTEPVETAVVEQHLVIVGRVILRFISGVPAGNRIGSRSKAIGDQQPVLAQIFAQPLQVSDCVGFRQPTRKADEESNIVRADLLTKMMVERLP
jgi:hypothetical protein